jgi:shikimate dehydrogenase
MHTYGLIGKHLSHSFSATYFNRKFKHEHIDAEYKLFELDAIDELPNLIARENPRGLNVTIPYKQQIIPHLHVLSEEATAVGAVNCVSLKEGRWIGHNTDILGFEAMFLPHVQEQAPALVFGTGGASQAVQYVLKQRGFPFTVLSRNDIQGGLTYADLSEDIIQAHPILINTTPVGMFPDVDHALPIPYQWISARHTAFDLIYNPPKTRFLAYCEAHGARIFNGQTMLEAQAEAAWNIFGL